MKLEQDEYEQLKKLMMEVNIIDENSGFYSDRLERFLKHADRLKEYLQATKEIYQNAEHKKKHPASHKQYGNVLIKTLYHGVDNGELAIVFADIVLADGSTQKRVPIKDIVPYNASSEILYGDNK